MAMIFPKMMSMLCPDFLQGRKNTPNGTTFDPLACNRGQDLINYDNGSTGDQQAR